MTNQQQESFKQAALPLIKWLCENVHPHPPGITSLLPKGESVQGGNLVTGWGGVLTINAPESIYSNLHAVQRIWNKVLRKAPGHLLMEKA